MMMIYNDKFTKQIRMMVIMILLTSIDHLLSEENEKLQRFTCLY